MKPQVPQAIREIRPCDLRSSRETTLRAEGRLEKFNQRFHYQESFGKYLSTGNAS